MSPACFEVDAVKEDPAIAALYARVYREALLPVKGTYRVTDTTEFVALMFCIC